MGGGAGELSGPNFEDGVSFGDLSPDKPLLGHAHGEPVVLVRSGDGLRAIGATCSHYGGPLAEGRVEGGTIRCPWHHACFDLATGAAVGAPALGDLTCYDVAREGDLVKVRGKREPAKKKPAKSPSSVVIVGAGAAGAACVEMLRKEGYAGAITMLGDEDPGPVDRPNLSKDYLAGKAPEEWLPLGTREHYEKDLRVELLAGDPAAAIDTAKKTVTTRSGKTIAYGALLFAPGAEPARLPIEGASLPHVHLLRSLADARAIIAAASANAGAPKRAVVIGASFIALEATASLVARGVEVSVVAPDPVPLARALGEALGAHVQKLHESKGVKFFLGLTPKAIREGAVDLSNGHALECDFVVMGVGVRPRLALAEAAGLKVEAGVVVDEALRASADGVWAAGDVARHPSRWLGGELVRIEHWVVAERHGQHAARSMLGAGSPYEEVPFFWTTQYDLTINYVGHAPRPEKVEVFGSIDKNDAAVAFRRAGKVNAVATINRDATSLAVEAAMERGDADAIEAILRA